MGFRPPPALALGTEGNAQCASCRGTSPGLSRYLPFCPSQEKQAPSRPFERWILLTYLAALASRVESWVLPDRAGILFVPLGKSGIPLEQGECVLAPWEPRCPTVPIPGVAAPAPAFCHVRHQAAFSLHFSFFKCVHYSGAFCCGGSYCLPAHWLFWDWGCVLCVCLFAF